MSEMSGQEAIEILQALKFISDIEDYSDRLEIALDVAIEALKARPHGECKTCKHFVMGGLDGKTYVCEHPGILLDDSFDYACITMNDDDFCSRYKTKER